MNVLEAIRSRRAVRSYSTEPVPEGIVHQLLDAAVRAPTAMHAEPWSFLVLQDAQVLDTLAARARRQHPEWPHPDIFHGAGTLVAIGARQPGPFVVADCWLAAENLMLAAHELGLATCPIGFALGALNDPETRTELRLPADLTIVAPIVVGYPRGTTAESPSPRKAPQIVRWIGPGR